MPGKMRWEAQSRAYFNKFANRFGFPTLKETLASEATEREISDMYDSAYKHYIGMGRSEEEAVAFAQAHARSNRDAIINRWELAAYHVVDTALWKIGLVSNISHDEAGDAVAVYTTRTYPSKTEWEDAARLLAYYIGTKGSLEQAMATEGVSSAKGYVQRHIYELPKVWNATLPSTPYQAFMEIYRSRSS